MSKDTHALSRAASLRHWYQRPLGRLLAEAELAALQVELPTLFGYHLMVIDPPWEHCRLDDSRIPHQVIQSVEPLTHEQAGLVRIVGQIVGPSQRIEGGTEDGMLNGLLYLLAEHI